MSEADGGQHLLRIVFNPDAVLAINIMLDNSVRSHSMSLKVVPVIPLGTRKQTVGFPPILAHNCRTLNISIT